MKCFSIRDIKAEGYNTPFYQPTFGLAERAFKEACQDQNSMLAKNPDDFSLYYIGTFDQTSGQFTPESAPQLVCQAR